MREIENDSEEPILENIYKVSIDSLDYIEVIRKSIEIQEGSDIHVGNRIKHENEHLILQIHIQISSSDKSPNFGKTLSFFSIDSIEYVIYEKWNTLNILSSCLGYVVTPSADIQIEKVNHLPHTKSYTVYNSYENEQVIVSNY